MRVIIYALTIKLESKCGLFQSFLLYIVADYSVPAWVFCVPTSVIVLTGRRFFSHLLEAPKHKSVRGDTNTLLSLLLVGYATRYYRCIYASITDSHFFTKLDHRSPRESSPTCYNVAGVSLSKFASPSGSTDQTARNLLPFVFRKFTTWKFYTMFPRRLRTINRPVATCCLCTNWASSIVLMQDLFKSWLVRLLGLNPTKNSPSKNLILFQFSIYIVYQKFNLLSRLFLCAAQKSLTCLVEVGEQAPLSQVSCFT